MANGEERPDEAATEQPDADEEDPREREPEMLAYRSAQERRAGRSG